MSERDIQEISKILSQRIERSERLFARTDVWGSEGTLYTPHFQPVSLLVMTSGSVGLDKRKFIINSTQTNKIHAQKCHPPKKTIMETFTL